MENTIFKQWRKERDEAVASLDLEKFKKFYSKWADRGVYQAQFPNDLVAEIAMYKCAVHITSLPDEIRKTAARWLLSRGYRLEL